MFRVIFGKGPLVIVAVFITAVLLLLVNYISNKQKIKNFLDSRETNNNLSDLYKDYKDSFIKVLNKTRLKAEEIFYVERVFSNFITYKHRNGIPLLEILKTIPNTLVGAGILGTFIGLALGISDFNTSSAEAITNSIDLLLSGIGTAFGTSIVGIFLSLFYNLLILKPAMAKMQEQCDRINNKLDNEYYIDEAEYIAQLFVIIDENGNKIFPKDVFRNIGEELEQQTVSLSGFSADLADELKNMTDAMLEKYNDEIYDMYKNTLQPEMEKLNKSIEYLHKEKQESSGEVIGEIVKNLQISLKDMVSEFKNAISGDTKNELLNLTSIITGAGESFSEIPDLITKQFERLQKNQENQMLYLDELIDTNIKAVESFRVEINETRNAVESLQEVSTMINTINTDFIKVSEGLSKTSSILNESLIEFTEKSMFLNNQNNKTTEKMEKITSSMNEVSESFSNVDQSLASVFDQMSEGLLEYKSNVEKSLGSYLNKYTDAISGYADRLANVAEEINESIEAFEDSRVNKIKSEADV